MANSISSQDLNTLIGTANAPMIRDVCLDADFADAPYLIPKAIRQNHQTVGGTTGADVVVICQKGKKLSQGVAAQLRYNGISAKYLEGGILAWLDHGLISLAAQEMPENGLWVVDENCPDLPILRWIFKRLIPHDHVLMDVPKPSVPDVADKFSAQIIDDCASLLSQHQISDPRLDHMLSIACTSRDQRESLAAFLSKTRNDAQLQIQIFDALWGQAVGESQ